MTTNSHPPRRRTLQVRIRDISVEVTIALLFLAVVLYGAAHSPLDGETVFRWFGLAGITAIAFGYPLRDFRKYWKRRRFWFAWTALLILHLAGYIGLLLTVKHFGTLWYVIITAAEWSVIFPLLEIAGRKTVGE